MFFIEHGRGLWKHFFRQTFTVRDGRVGVSNAVGVRGIGPDEELGRKSWGASATRASRRRNAYAGA